MDTVNLWKSSNKNRFELFFWGLSTLYGIWLSVREGFTWINIYYTVLVALVLILKVRSDQKLSNKESIVNKDLSDRGYKTVLEKVTTVDDGPYKFEGLVKDLVLYKVAGEPGKYSVGLSSTMGLTLYHFVFLGSDKKWVAVVDGNNIQYFAN